MMTNTRHGRSRTIGNHFLEPERKSDPDGSAPIGKFLSRRQGDVEVRMSTAALLQI